MGQDHSPTSITPHGKTFQISQGINKGTSLNNIYIQSKLNHLPGFNQQVPKLPQAESSNNLENLLKAYMMKNDALIQG